MRKQRLWGAGCHVLCPSCDSTQCSGFPVPVPFPGSSVFPRPSGSPHSLSTATSPNSSLASQYLVTKNRPTGSSWGRATPVWQVLLSFSFSPSVRICEQSRRENFNRPVNHKTHFPLTREVMCPGNEVLSVSLCPDTLSLGIRVFLTNAMALSPVAAQDFWVAALAFLLSQSAQTATTTEIYFLQLGGCKPRIKVPAHSVPPEHPLPGLQAAVFSPCLHCWEER